MLQHFADHYPYLIPVLIFLLVLLAPILIFFLWFIVATWFSLIDHLIYSAHTYLWRMGWHTDNPHQDAKYFGNTRRQRFGD